MTLSSRRAEAQPACRTENVMIIANLGGERWAGVTGCHRL
jgi:hypothetical protein